MTEYGERALTLIASESVAGGARVTHGTVQDADVVVYDSGASIALVDAVRATSIVERADNLARAQALATMTATHSPDNRVVVALDRPGPTASVRDVVRAVLGTWSFQATTLAALTQSNPIPAALIDSPTGDDRTQTVRDLRDDERKLVEFSSILTEPADLLGPERAELLQLLGNDWRERGSLWNVAAGQHRDGTAQTLSAVAIIPPQTDVTLLGSSAPLSFYVRNDLPWPATIELITTTDDDVLAMERSTRVTIGAAQNTRIDVPVSSRSASDEAVITMWVQSTTGVRVGEPIDVALTIRAEWETVGLVIIAVLVAGFLVIGVVRTVSRARDRRAKRMARKGGGA